MAVPLPRVPGAVPLEGAPVLLVVSADEVRLAGRGVGGAEDDERLASRLASDLRAMREVSVADDGKSALSNVALWAEPDVPLARLSALLSEASAEASFSLLVRASDVELPASANAPEWVREALSSGPEESFEEQRGRLEHAWERATESCPGARAHLPIPAALIPSGPPMGPPTVEPLIEALRGCECDEAALTATEALALGALTPSDGPLARVRPTLRFGHATDEARELRFDGTRTVEALAEALASRTDERLWIVVE